MSVRSSTAVISKTLQYNAKIEQWSLSIITPIFKTGSKMDPSNYRRISLLSCLEKLFSAILNQRLLRYVLENKILKVGQLGFLAGNRTSDSYNNNTHVTTIFLPSKGEENICCFVDFSKAFDTLPRDLLFTKL